MESEVMENMWKVMKENSLQLIDQTNNDLICNICNQIMIKACDGVCGCKYCSDCIADYLDGKDKFCPGESEFCQLVKNYENDVSISYVTNMKISEIVAKCPNEYCEFTYELIELHNHMRTCNKNKTSCPYFEIGCENEEVKKDEMRDHLYTEIFCHTKLLLDFITNLRNDVESMKNEIIELKSENKNLKEELEIIKFDSKNINQPKIEEFEKKIMNNLSEIEELNEEMVAIKNENRSLVDKLEKIKKLRINEVIETMQRKSEQQTREIEEMKEKCEQTENKEVEMRKIIGEILDKNADLMKKSIDYNEKINNLHIKLIEMERITEIMNFGKFEWKIENFSQQQQKTLIYSKSFYSHKNGYKMCLSVLIAGNLVYVYFHIMKGEFDNDLLWPFKHAITIDVTNQMNGMIYNGVTIKYDDDTNNLGWNKQKTERNDGIWFHTMKKSREIIHNDQIIIKCKLNS